MNKTIAIAIAALFAFASVPSVDAAGSEDHSYITGTPGRGTVIWCSAEEHSIIPKGDPDDYGHDPDDPLDPVWSLEGWAWSGEPECAAHDVSNAAREAQGEERMTGGYGGAAYMVTAENLLGTLTSSTDDDLFGVAQSYQLLVAWRDAYDADGVQQREVSEGCGSQTITIPEDIERHWQSSNSDPYYISWVYIRGAGVDEDLTACFASTGVVTGTFA